MLSKNDLNELLTVLRENRVQFFKCESFEVAFPHEGYPMTVSSDEEGFDLELEDTPPERIRGVPDKYYDPRLFPNGTPSF